MYFSKHISIAHMQLTETTITTYILTNLLLAVTQPQNAHDIHTHQPSAGCHTTTTCTRHTVHTHQHSAVRQEF